MVTHRHYEKSIRQRALTRDISTYCQYKKFRDMAQGSAAKAVCQKRMDSIKARWPQFAASFY